MSKRVAHSNEDRARSTWGQKKVIIKIILTSLFSKGPTPRMYRKMIASAMPIKRYIAARIVKANKKVYIFASWVSCQGF